MKNFFNGASSEEIAGLNAQSSGIAVLVKNVMSDPEVMAQVTAHLDDDELMKIQRIVNITAAVCSHNVALQSFQIDEVWAKISRNLNRNSALTAKNHGFETYMKLVNGAVKEDQLKLTKKED